MALNSYFNQKTFVAEQDLLQDLIDESIQIYGHDTHYLKRDDVDVDLLFGEDELSTFTSAYAVEMYIKSQQSFQGQGEFISKFGLHIEDQCTFTLSLRRWEQLETGLVRPREGDIIWLQMTPRNRYLFEIRFVENKEQLFQLGKLYTYELRCEMMTYSHERVQTAVANINSTATQSAYTLEIPLATGAGAYIVGETVYQGASFIEHNATATVSAWDANTDVLSVQNISGTFGDTSPVVGVTSGCERDPLDAPDTIVSTLDPIADNERIEDESESIIVVRGTNPRRTN